MYLDPPSWKLIYSGLFAMSLYVVLAEKQQLIHLTKIRFELQFSKAVRHCLFYMLIERVRPKLFLFAHCFEM